MKAFLTVLALMTSLSSFGGVLNVDPRATAWDLMQLGECQITTKVDFVFKKNEQASVVNRTALVVRTPSQQVTKVSAGRVLKLSRYEGNGTFSVSDRNIASFMVYFGSMTYKYMNSFDTFKFECFSNTPVEI
jgi:hypothetical protein